MADKTFKLPCRVKLVGRGGSPRAKLSHSGQEGTDSSGAVEVSSTSFTRQRKRISHASARAKGNGFEKSVAEDVAALLGLPADDIIHSGSGRSGRDIRIPSAYRNRFPYFVESKNQRTLKIPEWLRHTAQRAKPTGDVPLVVFKLHRDNTKFVTLPWEHFLYLVSITKGNY